MVAKGLNLDVNDLRKKITNIMMYTHGGHDDEFLCKLRCLALKRMMWSCIHVILVQTYEGKFSHHSFVFPSSHPHFSICLTSFLPSCTTDCEADIPKLNNDTRPVSSSPCNNHTTRQDHCKQHQTTLIGNPSICDIWFGPDHGLHYFSIKMRPLSSMWSRCCCKLLSL